MRKWKSGLPDHNFLTNSEYTDTSMTLYKYVINVVDCIFFTFANSEIDEELLLVCMSNVDVPSFLFFTRILYFNSC